MNKILVDTNVLIYAKDTDSVFHQKSLGRSYSILQDLISQHKPKGLKIHDFEIASIAIAHGVNQIATFNKSDFQSIQEIAIITP